jgi:uncharacterized metal-binding protein
MTQVKANIATPVQLILDMKVRWSSTYMMLDRAERNKEVCLFIYIAGIVASHIHLVAH